jgi:hypothetical protein
MDGWIVLYVPRGVTWVTSTSPYHYSSESQTFHQTQKSAELLAAVLQANKQALGELIVENDVNLGRVRSGDEPVVVKKGEKLRALCDVGAREEVLAPKALEALLAELEKQTK